MKKLSLKQIHEIGQDIEAGMKCFINKETGEYRTIIDIPEAYEDELWGNELEEIEREWEDYLIIEKMDSWQGFKVMEGFVYKLPQSAIKQKLINCLNGKRPFRNFKFQIDNSGDLREKWFSHRSNEYRKYVKGVIEYHFEIDQEVESKISPNFDGKTFLLVQNSNKGKVNADTKFHFKQEDNLVTADYYGGGIRFGKIIGLLSRDFMSMVYQCVTEVGELKSGKAEAKIELNEAGKLQMSLDWEWLTGSGEEGVSEYIEE